MSFCEPGLTQHPKILEYGNVVETLIQVKKLSKSLFFAGIFVKKNHYKF